MRLRLLVTAPRAVEPCRRLAISLGSSLDCPLCRRQGRVLLAVRDGARAVVPREGKRQSEDELCSSDDPGSSVWTARGTHTVETLKKIAAALDVDLDDLA